MDAKHADDDESAHEIDWREVRYNDRYVVRIAWIPPHDRHGQRYGGCGIAAYRYGDEWCGRMAGLPDQWSNSLEALSIFLVAAAINFRPSHTHDHGSLKEWFAYWGVSISDTAMFCLDTGAIEKSTAPQFLIDWHETRAAVAACETPGTWLTSNRKAQ